jgi:molybdopterin converting factor small subunit
LAPRTIRVEFFGVSRQRAGTADIDVTLDAESATLGDVLRETVRQCPLLLGACLEPDGRLKPGYVVNLDGQRFVREPQTPLQSVQSILFLSADAGG